MKDRVDVDGWQVILESRNDLDITQQELDDAANRIRAGLPDTAQSVEVVTVAHRADGVGSHWEDVLNVFIPSKDFLKDFVWTMILGEIKDTMRARFKRKHEKSRPRIIVVVSADTSDVERVLRLEDPEGEFVERDTHGGKRDPPSLPPAAQ